MSTKDIKNKKQNLSFMLLVILLVSVILCISSFGIATWARYRSVTGGNVEAQIARWSFKVNGEEEKFATIDLADTIDFTHVTTDKIAPGTYGSFDLVIDGSGSEVSIEYYININIGDKPTNLKFYTDELYQNELVVENNKIQIDDEILLADIDTPVTKTIYWKWDYRTQNLPSEFILNGYMGVIDGLRELTQQYNEIGLTQQQQQELIYKINDKIDTYEEGGEVFLGVSVRGIQKYPDGLVFKSIYITSTTDELYVKNDVVTLDMEFTEKVYADANQTALTNQTAPTLSLEFGTGTETANSLVVKLASRAGEILKLANNSYKTAAFVGVDRNKIKYSYTIDENDSGDLKIAGISGTLYSKSGKQIQLEKNDLKGRTISVDQSVVKASNWYENGNTGDLFSDADQLLGTAGGKSYYKLNDIPAIGVSYYDEGVHFALISTNVDGTLGYCSTTDNESSSGNNGGSNTISNSESEYQTVEVNGITWYVRELPGGWSDGTTATTNNCNDIGTITSETTLVEVAETGVSDYFNIEKQVNVGTVLKIYNAQDLKNVQEAVNDGTYSGNIVLNIMRNIDLSSICSNELGSWTPIGSLNSPCQVQLKGNNKVISGIYINNTVSASDRQGLFGYAINSSFENIKLGGTIYDTKSSYVGLLAGVIENSTVYNVEIISGTTVKGVDSVGGMVGCVAGTSISRVRNYSPIEGNLFVGGIIGYVDSGSIIVESANEAVANITAARGHVGGIAGSLNGTNIEKSYNKANITGNGNDGTGYTSVGGIVGSGGIVYDCYNFGNIYGAMGQSGGIKGNGYRNGSNHIQRCYNIGTITGGNRANGSIVGENNESSILTCFYTSSANACGYRGSASNTRQVTDSELKESGFGATNLGENWTDDIHNINNGYPILKWQLE